MRSLSAKLSSREPKHLISVFQYNIYRKAAKFKITPPVSPLFRYPSLYRQKSILARSPPFSVSMVGYSGKLPGKLSIRFSYAVTSGTEIITLIKPEVSTVYSITVDRTFELMGLFFRDFILN